MVGLLEQSIKLHYLILEEVINSLICGSYLKLIINLFRSGWSPLLLAASNGHLELVKIFLDVNARVDVFDQEARSALHLAAESGNADICEMLLAKNAYVNSKTKAGWTPLHYVAFNGFNKLIQPLVSKHNAAIDSTSMVSLHNSNIRHFLMILKNY